MGSEPISLKEQHYLCLLENLIRKKLDDEEIDIGITYRSSNIYSVISLDEYDKGNINLHLYCSVKQQFSFEVSTTDDDGNEKVQVSPLTPENILIIPEGLRLLMLEAVADKKGTVFTPGQIRH